MFEPLDYITFKLFSHWTLDLQSFGPLDPETLSANLRILNLVPSQILIPFNYSAL